MSLNKALDRLFDEIRREAKRNPPSPIGWTACCAA